MCPQLGVTQEPVKGAEAAQDGGHREGRTWAVQGAGSAGPGRGVGCRQLSGLWPEGLGNGGLGASPDDCHWPHSGLGWAGHRGLRTWLGVGTRGTRGTHSRSVGLPGRPPTQHLREPSLGGPILPAVGDWGHPAVPCAFPSC